MAVPTIVQNTQSKETNDVTTHTVALAGDEATGNIIIIVIGGRQDNVASPDFDEPAGWTRVGESGDATSDCHVAVYRREVTGTESASYDFTSTTATRSVSYAIEISGVSTSAPVNTSLFDESASGASTTWTASEVTTDADDCLILAVFTAEGGDAIPASIAGTGWVEYVEDFTHSALFGACAYVAQKDLATAGASVDADITFGASYKAAWGQIALAPPASTNTTIEVPLGPVW